MSLTLSHPLYKRTQIAKAKWAGQFVADVNSKKTGNVIRRNEKPCQVIKSGVLIIRDKVRKNRTSIAICEDLERLSIEASKAYFGGRDLYNQRGKLDWIDDTTEEDLFEEPTAEELLFEAEAARRGIDLETLFNDDAEKAESQNAYVPAFSGFPDTRLDTLPRSYPRPESTNLIIPPPEPLPAFSVTDSILPPTVALRATPRRPGAPSTALPH